MSPTQNFPCPQCGAKAEFDPEAGKLQCSYCGWENAVPDTITPVREHSYEEYLNRDRLQFAVLSETVLEVRCQSCGANIIFEPPQTASQCPFCAAAIVTQPQQASPTVMPEGVVPFAIGRNKARKCLQDWLKKLWFAPNALKTLARQEKLQGIYLPFWTYDAQTHSHYRGERGDYYYTTETYTTTNENGEEVTETREVRHTRWSPASGRISRFFDDILITGTKSVDRQRLDTLEPWHLPQSLKPYNPSFLAGFEAQRPQISVKTGFAHAKTLMEWRIRQDVKRDIGGDTQNIRNISTQYSAIAFKHILLPVWLTAYCYQNKRYQVMVNACTGEVQGDRPYSWLKITGAVTIGLLIAISIVILWIQNA